MNERADRFNPFPGLRPFGPDEDYLFFGREDQTDELLRRLRQHRFLAVVGSSGSGKSSLVRAGLMPALHGGFMAGAGSRWRVALMRPGRQPTRALAQALQAQDALGSPDDEDLSLRIMLAETTLRRSAMGLVEIAEQARLPDGENLLVVVDQFEELFRFKERTQSTSHGEQAGDEAAAFVKLLLEAVRTDRVPLYVVLTMRSDFLGDCSQFRDLPETINDAQFLVPRLTRTQRRRAIEGPVAVGRATMTPRLVQRLLNDVGDNPDQLPILQHALMRTWEHWLDHHDADEPLDVPHYEAIGTMDRALSEHGDEIYGELPDDDHRAIAERMFKRLTDRGVDARGLRRPTPLATLCAVSRAEVEKVQAVIEAFRRPDRSLLMPPAGTPLEPETVIDISHESLMRVWDRLKAWADEEAESAQTYRRLAEAATLYAEGKLSLWNDPELQLALAWRETARPTAPWAAIYNEGFEPSMAFLDESTRVRDAERQAQEAHRRHELEQAQALAREQQQRAQEQAAAARRLRRRLVLTLVLALIAAAAALFAVRNAWLVKEQARLAESRRLAQQVFAHLENRHDMALLLSVEAVRTEPTEAARSSLLSALEHNPHLDAFLHAHHSAVTSVAFSPVDSLLASSSRDGTVVLWDLKTNRRMGSPLQGHTDAVTSLAFSPDGTRLASGSWDATILLWDVATRQPTDTLAGHTDAVYAVAFSPDGTRLASGSRDSTIFVWELPDGRPRRRLTGHTDAVTSLAFSPDGERLASGSYDNTLRVWDVETGQVQGGPLRSPNALVYAVAFSPDGTRLASGSDDALVRLWDAERYQLIDTLHGHQNAVYGVTFSPDGTLLASSSWDNTVLLWDVATRKQRGQPLNGHQEYVSSVAFSPDGRRLASGGYDNVVILWQVETGEPFDRRFPPGHKSVVLSVAFSPDGTRLVSGSGDNTLLLWDTERNDSLGPPLASHRSVVNRVAFSPDGRRLASGSLDNTVIVWDAATRQPLHTLVGHHAFVLSVAFSPDGSRLASGSWDNTIILWDAATYEPLDTLRNHRDAVWSVAFSPDGRRLASGSRDKSVIVWDVETGQALDTLSAHQAVVYSVAFSPDDSLLASGSGDNTIILWDADTYLPLDTLTGHNNYVQSVAFSPDGHQLASGSWDKTIRLWEIDTGERLWQLTGHTSVVNSVAFSPDGDQLASGSWDKTIRLWDVATGESRTTPDQPEQAPTWQDREDSACRKANRNLTLDEWKRIFGDTPYRRTCPDE